MYQQNPYQQQQQSGQQQVQLKDEDLANFVLNELKRSAREYTTAALEAANPQI
ncbi:spore coat protein, partial [Paenibacillus sp. TAF58]